MKKTLKSLFLSVFLMTLSIGCNMHVKKKESGNYVGYVDQIIKSFADKMKTEMNLICIGDGGKMPYDVEEISVKFIAYRKASIEEARKLEVKATQKLLEIINSHEKIRPFLREYPFKSNRTKVSIAFMQENSEHSFENSISYITLIRGRIFYFVEDISKDTQVQTFEESYEEALKIIQASP